MLRTWRQKVTMTDIVVWGIGIFIGIMLIVGFYPKRSENVVEKMLAALAERGRENGEGTLENPGKNPGNLGTRIKPRPTHAINSARERIWIASPYFVPDKPVTDALQLAGLRGVDVRILIPDKSDNRSVDLAA